MFKKCLIFLLVCMMALCVGCGKEEKEVAVDDGKTSVSSESEEKVSVNLNPLTGETNLTPEESKQQPVAIMVGNSSNVHKVQTGVSKADIVYETEVEGGITRLMAVFQNIDKVQRVGTIRSARYAYVDLALGHNAVYLHCGQDDVYCGPHLADITHYSVDTGNVGKRIKNGLASEHTLYADGADIYNKFMKDRKLDKVTAWQNFEKDGKDVTLSGGAATDVTVAFSSSYKTQFKYDAESGKYTRYFRGTANKDYVTEELTQVKNVFAILTTISSYPNGHHRKVNLESGDGYYFANGTYTKIKWKKGAANNSFEFTNEDGSELVVNQGNSWVCIADKSNKVAIN